MSDYKGVKMTEISTTGSSGGATSEVFIIPSQKEKPIKIVKECKANAGKIKEMRIPPQEVMKNILKYDNKLRSHLTIQQIRSEYGKLRSSNWDETVAFLLKNGVTMTELSDKFVEKHLMAVISVNIGIDMLHNPQIGLYQVY